MIAELPEQDEFVLAIIKKIMPYGAFCILPEYDSIESFMHISEVAPRWIKNIHEFISEGQQHVVKVVHVDKQKGQVDISLKRVNEEEKKRKLESIRTEKKSRKILEVALTASKSSVTFEQVKNEITKKYDDLYDCFEAISEKGEDAFEGIELPDRLKKQISEIAKKTIKKPTVQISGLVKLISYDADGIDKIKEIFDEVTKTADKLVVQYLGAPNYKISITARNHKEGDKMLANIAHNIEKSARSLGCEFSFEKKDN